jgi:hypothetical protein
MMGVAKICANNKKATPSKNKTTRKTCFQINIKKQDQLGSWRIISTFYQQTNKLLKPITDRGKNQPNKAAPYGSAGSIPLQKLFANYKGSLF